MLMTIMTGLLTESLSSLSGRPASADAARRRAEDRAPERTRKHTARRRQVIGQDLFLDALVRERKRADRFDQPFMLLLIAADNRVAADASSWAPVIAGLAAAKRETDVLGWYERGAVLGVILPEVNPSDVEATAAIGERVRRELAARIDADTAASYSIELHLHSGLPALGRSATSLRAALKRGLDILGSLALLAALAPLFLAIAALIKLTSAGPVFFRQQRVGEAAIPFMMLKFRTMRVDADPAIHQEYVRQFITANAAATSGDAGAVFKITNDPRVTPLGRLLRRTSLDELPQFWNVLRGDMSLVGPRPPLQYEVEAYKPWHLRRVLEAKPGITGLWQVAGRSRTTFDDMVRLDLRYAQTHSVWTDIRILLATPRAVITGRGAC
jgi:lipopolysaccharide/colanic/teichoic acid biosynthesis glycosyltransferase